VVGAHWYSIGPCRHVATGDSKPTNEVPKTPAITGTLLVGPINCLFDVLYNHQIFIRQRQGSAKNTAANSFNIRSGVGIDVRVRLFICLSVCPQHNSKTNDPKVFKLVIGMTLEWPWDIIEMTWFWVSRSRVSVSVKATAIRREFELYECHLVLYAFQILIYVRPQSSKPSCFGLHLLSFWPNITANWWARSGLMMMDCLCGKFGDCSFSHLGFYHADKQTHRQNHRRR